jgi:hypothetical protein
VTSIVNLGYTFTGGHEDSRGFSSTTAGDPASIERSAIAAPHHTGTLGVSLRIPRWIRVGGFFRVASASRFTPRVNGDVNGDGLSNDRPFVFDTVSTTNPLVVTDMKKLLSSVPGPIRRCLTDQLGRVAGPNTCSGPITTSLNLTATPDPYLLHLGNRGTLTIIATNVLGGLDAVVHGSSHLRGWGAAQLPDATLLQVQGFDPATKQFRYAVNPAFGSTSQARAVWAAPFTMTIDFRFRISPDEETRAIESFLAPAKASPSSVLTASQIRARFNQASSNRIALLLRLRDSLRLNQTQVDSISAIRDEYQRHRDSAYDWLAGALAARAGNYNSDAARSEWHDILAWVQSDERVLWARVRALLTSEQYAQLPDRLKFLDDATPAWITYIQRVPRLWPP